jgi:hypothetical protein
MLSVIRFLLGSVLVLGLAAVIVFFITTDKQPKVKETSLSGLNDAESVTQLLRQLQTSIHDRNKPQNVIVTKTQINSLLAFIEKAKPEIRSKVHLSETITSMQLSYVLPDIWFGRYANLYISLLPGSAIQLERVELGAISLPGDWVMSFLVMVVNQWTQSDIATYALNHVTKVSMSSDKVSIEMKPLGGILARLSEIKNDLSLERGDWLSQRTAFYIRFLARTSVNNVDITTNTEPSLSIYLAAVMREAMRSGTAVPERENEAALLALTIFAGHHRFANFVGFVHTEISKVPLPPYPTRLAMRKDLSQHFIISAGLKLISEKQVTAAIGEFKELMDRVLGGSGYSFVDLAADMAGVRLAQAATDPAQAARIQRELASTAGEDLFFPLTQDLPEGLSKAEFNLQFEYVNSPQYIQMLEKIQLRLENLPLYIAD